MRLINMVAQSDNLEKPVTSATPRRIFFKVALLASALVFCFALADILWQYRWYFPADFQNAGFLRGRQSFFHGAYRIAFYGHIVCGPMVMLVALFLLWSGRRGMTSGLHRRLGKIQFLAVVVVLGPTGLWMATRAYTGIVAGVGFGILSLLTMAATVKAVLHIRKQQIALHQLWASRLVVLLLSPIALRIITRVGVAIGFDARGAYQFSAWASWLAPLIAFELWVRYKSLRESNNATVHPLDKPISQQKVESAL